MKPWWTGLNKLGGADGMAEAINTSSGSGVALEIAEDRLRLIAALGEDSFEELDSEPMDTFFLPVKEFKTPRRANLADWLSETQLDYIDANGKLSRKTARERLVQKMGVLLGRARKRIQPPPGLVKIVVPSSLTEKNRFHLVDSMRAVGLEAGLVNEERALVLRRPHLSRRPLLVFSLSESFINISWFETENGSQSLRSLEVEPKCGVDYITLHLLESLLGKADVRLSNPNDLLRTTFNLRLGLAHWTGSELLACTVIQDGKPRTLTLPADEARVAIDAILSPSLSTARRMIPMPAEPFQAVLLAPLLAQEMISERISHAIGAPIERMDRQLCREGAALEAWQQAGRISPEIRTPPSDQPVPAADAAPARESDAEAQTESLAAWLRAALEPVVDAFDSSGHTAMAKELPNIEWILEEFHAKLIDRMAKRLSDANRFDEAWMIYNRYFSQGGGYAYLAAPALGLCLTQARLALKSGNRSQVKKWCERGLKFNPRHADLISLKKQLKRSTN